MDDESQEKNWKLKLRYGVKTPFQHFTLLADGVVGDLMDGFSCRPGKAIMAMKVWASSTDEAFDMIRTIGEQIGFTVTGRIKLYETLPDSPPRENPHGYGITFTPYDHEQEQPTIN
jgi:hypothetical protein